MSIVPSSPDARNGGIDRGERDERHLARALALARQGYDEGGCPIGAVLFELDTGAVLGEGHNGLVQEGNPILHGEMAALRSAGRMANRHRTTMVTTLQPCFMCAGAIAMFGIPRVVVGDTANAGSDETIRFLRARGVEVVVMDPATSAAAAGCIALGARARRERPELWLEDWGGGPNPALLEAPPRVDSWDSVPMPRPRED